jgi:CubicO group peptidase (beta-lactamase class C family)
MRNNLSAKKVGVLVLGFLFTFYLYTPVLGNSNNKKTEKTNHLLETKISGNVPGASVLVIHQGKVVFKKAYGFANVEENTPNTPQTIFRLGSVSKQFTAMAIMQLHNKKLLSYNDSVDKFFPELVNGGKITIRNLLTHTSGILESADSELEFIPGSRMNYSNTGYNLLGKIIEKVSGLSYAEFLSENIFKPLLMVNTGFEHAGQKPEKMASGYKPGNGNYIASEVVDVSGAYAAGALYSTTEDMYLWNNALDSEKLVEKSTLEQAFTPATLNNGSQTKYGFGWMLNLWNGIKEVSHGGDITGFNSYICRIPEEHFAVIVLSNFEMNPPGPIPNAGQLAHEIAEIYLSDKISNIPAKKSLTLSSAVLKTYEGKYKLEDAPEEIVGIMGDLFSFRTNENRIFIVGKLGEVELCAETPNKFYLEDKTTIEFNSENEQVSGFTMDLMGMGVRILVAKKIKD